MAPNSFVKAAQTVNSKAFKQMIRKNFHKKGSSADSMRESTNLEVEEAKNKRFTGESENNIWVPHERTGIYYPKGQEKVMEDIPPCAGKDTGINCFPFER